MRLSSGTPRDTGLDGITRIIRARVSATTVSRPSRTKGSLDQNTETTTDHTEDLWLFEPREALAEEIVGERINGSLGALAVSDGTVDLQTDDRVTHGGVTYEVDTVVGHPEDGAADGTSTPDTDFWIVTFTRRQ